MTNLDYKELKQDSGSIVYVTTRTAWYTRIGRPKFNIMGASKIW